jgi:hypothetical protein
MPLSRRLILEVYRLLRELRESTLSELRFRTRFRYAVEDLREALLTLRDLRLARRIETERGESIWRLD